MTRLVPFNMKKFVEQVGQNNATRLVETLTLEDAMVDIETLWAMEVFIPKGVLPVGIRNALIKPLKEMIDNYDPTTDPSQWRQYSTKAWDIMVHSLISSEVIRGDDVSLVFPLGALSRVTHSLEYLMNLKRDVVTAKMLDRQFVSLDDLMGYNMYQRVYVALSSLYAEALRSATIQATENQELEVSEQ